MPAKKICGSQIMDLLVFAGFWAIKMKYYRLGCENFQQTETNDSPANELHLSDDSNAYFRLSPFETKL